LVGPGGWSLSGKDVLNWFSTRRLGTPTSGSKSLNWLVPEILTGCLQLDLPCLPRKVLLPAKYTRRSWGYQVCWIPVDVSCLCLARYWRKTQPALSRQGGYGYLPEIRTDLKKALPFWPNGLPKWHDNWLSLGMRVDEKKSFLVIWRRAWVSRTEVGPSFGCKGQGSFPKGVLYCCQY
jgi:hypothetical protein